MLGAHKKIKHIGFKGLEGKLASEGYSKKSQGNIAGAAARNASKAAHKANPRLAKVKG